MFRYHFQEQIAEVIKVILQQRVSERSVEQIVAAVPQIMDGGPQYNCGAFRGFGGGGGGFFGVLRLFSRSFRSSEVERQG